MQRKKVLQHWHQFGVDVSPMAIKILTQDHPKYQGKEVQSFEYGSCFGEGQTLENFIGP
jgi:hypothetical protein